MATASAGNRLKLCLVLHAHQPVGNFDGTIEEVYNLCYLPFLQEFRKFPRVKGSLHYSGSLLVWLEKRHPEYFDFLREAIADGQVELVGGGMYEPILPLLPERDRLGQIAVMQEYLAKHFHVSPATFWLPERVWEQSLVTTLATAGVKALTLDDSHFKNAGWPAEALTGPFVGEDRGQQVTILPAVEKLRYLIPFSKVHEAMDKLREWYEAQRWSGLPEVLTYADDTEKFGSWPHTYKHCFTEGWLGGFLNAVNDSGDWLETIFESQAMNEPKRGVAYLPDASYREMGEWALPAGVLSNYLRREKSLKGNSDFESLKGHLRGGTWRNFRNKYPEATRMYAKLMHVSSQVAEWADGGAKKGAKAPNTAAAKKNLATAQDFLYQGECNCAHWHGVFGGLYLPHLRTAIFENLIKAQNLAEASLYAGGSTPGEKPYTHFETRDFDFDGYEEVYLSNRHLGLYVKPGRGGHITELDVRKIAANGIDTLARRYEAYHDDVARAVVEKQGDPRGGGGEGGEGESKSIHDQVLAKEAGLEKLLQYDRYTRESCIDHIFATMPSLEALAAAKQAGNEQFLEAGYEFEGPRPAKSGGGIELNLSRTATADGVARLTIEKTLVLAADAGELRCRHRVTNAGQGAMRGVLGIEHNFSMLAPDAFDRRYRTPAEKDAGPMLTTRDFGPLGQIELYDDWRKLRFIWRFETPARVFVHPIRTVSQSEGGFESVYQSSAVYALFEMTLAPGQTAEFETVLEVQSGY